MSEKLYGKWTLCELENVVENSAWVLGDHILLELFAHIRKLEKGLKDIAKDKVDIPSEYATRYEAAAYHDLVLYLKTIAREALGAE